MANVFLRAPMADLLQPNKIQSMDKEGKALTKLDRVPLTVLPARSSPCQSYQEEYI